jgi:hypothetical protein
MDDLKEESGTQTTDAMAYGKCILRLDFSFILRTNSPFSPKIKGRSLGFLTWNERTAFASVFRDNHLQLSLPVI